MSEYLTKPNEAENSGSKRDSGHPVPTVRTGLEAVQVMKRDRPMWQVNIPASMGGGKRQRVFRATKDDALTAARDIVQEKRRFGNELSDLTVDERHFVLRWRGRLTTLQMDEALEEAEKRLQGGITARQAVSKYLAAPRERALSKDHTRNLRYRLGAFATEFDRRLLSSITPGEIQSFVRGFGASARNVHRPLRALYGHAVLHEWIPSNPFLRVAAPEHVERDKEVYLPAEMRVMLRVAAGIEAGSRRDTRGRETAIKLPSLIFELVLSGLCGLRHTEARRLTADCIDLQAGAHGEIHVRRMKTQIKGIRERFVALAPLSRAWLDFCGLPESGKLITVMPKHLTNWHKRLVVNGKIAKWHHNGLRRSFGSYHLAAYENAALTAEIMGHTDAETTKAKYRVARRKAVAEEWFALTPEAVLAPVVTAA